MTTLTVWKFDTPAGAETVESALLDLQKRELIKVEDAAVVSWYEQENKPRTRQLSNLAGVGALSGGFWGLLFGVLFLMPLLGAAVGAAAGALGGHFADVGIDKEFIEKVKAEVGPGTSALFLLSSGAVVERLRDALPEAGRVQLIESNLTAEQERKLREVFES